MTPTDKARELVEDFYQMSEIMTWDKAKNLAHVVADSRISDEIDIPYWQTVKTEIEKL